MAERLILSAPITPIGYASPDDRGRLPLKKVLPKTLEGEKTFYRVHFDIDTGVIALIPAGDPS